MKLPFSLVPERKLKGLSKMTLGVGQILKSFFPYLEMYLKQAEFDYNAREYLAMCAVSNVITFIFLFILTSVATVIFVVPKFYLLSFLISFVLILFIFLQQTFYPKLVASRRVKNIDRNLLAALRTLLIHINSGIPLFDTMVSISKQNYGGVSDEFRKIVKKVSSGISAVDAIEDSATNSPSVYYRRSLWQISNGMKAGSNVAVVLHETIDNLAKEQLIQIEQYGSQLSPLAMFYMIIAVIMPALAITMLLVLTSFVAMSVNLIQGVFYGIYVLLILFQIIFLGTLKTRRPNLIGF